MSTPAVLLCKLRFGLLLLTQLGRHGGCCFRVCGSTDRGSMLVSMAVLRNPLWISTNIVIRRVAKQGNQYHACIGC